MKESYEDDDARQFGPKCLKFAPESSEVKQRLWTRSSAALVQHTEVMHVEGRPARPFVVDGRVRSKVDGKSSFGLFWLIPRAKEEKDPNVNLQLVYVETSSSFVTKLDSKPHTFAVKPNESPSVPVLTNPEPVAAKTRLLAAPDSLLGSLYSEIQNDIMSEKKKEDDDKKRKAAAAAAEAKKKAKGE